MTVALVPGPNPDATSVPPDALSHTELARALIAHVERLPPGSVIAVQGTWGRGKTDLLRRTYDLLASPGRSKGTTKPLWINPWQYGTADLITPLVLELVTRVRLDKRSHSLKLREAARTLLRAGSAVMVKGASLVVPVVGPLITAVADPVDDLIKDIFDSSDPPQDSDPIKVMASTFRNMVDTYKSLTSSENDRLVVLIDDLDRCLPDHQIAILESIHFLIGSGADCCFIIAIDPQLVMQAAITHYKVAAFDVEQYLDKLFDIRINLSYLRSGDTVTLFRDALTSSLAKRSHQLERPDHVVSLLRSEYGNVAMVPTLNNPRIITRVSRRLELFLAADPEMAPSTENEALALLSWLVICERWPQLRLVPQTIENDNPPSGNAHLKRLFMDIATLFGSTAVGAETKEDVMDRLRDDSPIVQRLSAVEREPDLGVFLGAVFERARGRDSEGDDIQWLIDRWMSLDGNMRKAAL